MHCFLNYAFRYFTQVTLNKQQYFYGKNDSEKSILDSEKNRL